MLQRVRDDWARLPLNTAQEMLKAVGNWADIPEVGFPGI